MSDRVRLEVDGKYTFIIPADDYRVHVLRYGEPWAVFEHNAVSALVYELAEAREGQERDWAFRAARKLEEEG